MEIIRIIHSIKIVSITREKGKFRCRTIVTNPKNLSAIVVECCFEILHCSRLANMSCNNFVRDKAFISLQSLLALAVCLSESPGPTFFVREMLAVHLNGTRIFCSRGVFRGVFTRQWAPTQSSAQLSHQIVNNFVRAFFVNSPPQAGRKPTRFFS